MDFIRKVARGRTYSLAAHFWLFLVAVNVAANIAWGLYQQHNLSLDPEDTGWWIVIGTAVAYIGWTLVALGGLINCARFKPTVFAKTAVVLATLSVGPGIVLGTAEGARILLGYASSVTIEEGVKAINAQLPHYDPATGTTLSKMEYDWVNKTLTTHIRQDLAPNVASLTPDALKRGLFSEACTNIRLYRRLEAVHVVYSVPGRPDVMTTIYADDCRA